MSNLHKVGNEIREHQGVRITDMTRRMVFCETFQGGELLAQGAEGSWTLCFRFLWVPLPPHEGQSIPLIKQ